MKKLIRRLLGIEPNLNGKPNIGEPRVITINNATGDLWCPDLYENPTNTKRHGNT